MCTVNYLEVKFSNPYLFNPFFSYYQLKFGDIPFFTSSFLMNKYHRTTSI